MGAAYRRRRLKPLMLGRLHSPIEEDLRERVLDAIQRLYEGKIACIVGNDFIVIGRSPKSQKRMRLPQRLDNVKQSTGTLKFTSEAHYEEEKNIIHMTCYAFTVSVLGKKVAATGIREALGVKPDTFIKITDL